MRTKKSTTTTTTAVKRHKSNAKKKCNRGPSCPYLSEAQHLQEYSHENSTDSFKNVQVASKGQKLGGKLNVNVSRKQILAEAVEKRLKQETTTGIKVETNRFKSSQIQLVDLSLSDD